jgi:hypothetical protein
MDPTALDAPDECRVLANAPAEDDAPINVATAVSTAVDLIALPNLFRMWIAPPFPA